MPNEESSCAAGEQERHRLWRRGLDWRRHRRGLRPGGSGRQPRGPHPSDDSNWMSITSVDRDYAEDRRRWFATYILCIRMLMIVLDATIVNVALPTIQEDLDFSQNELAWVVNAYLIAFGGLLLLSGRIGDLIGQRRIF